MFWKTKDRKALFIKKGDVKFETERYIEALEDYSMAMKCKFEKDDYLLYFKLGICFCAIMQWEKCISNIKKGMELNPPTTVIHDYKNARTVNVEDILKIAQVEHKKNEDFLKNYRIKIIEFMISQSFDTAMKIGLMNEEEKRALADKEMEIIRNKAGRENSDLITAWERIKRGN